MDRIIKNKRRNDDLSYLKKDLENEFNQLRENVIYSQQMLGVGSWTHSIAKNKTFFSDKIYDILGCDAEELDDLKSFYMYIHPDDREQVKKEVQEALKGKEYDIEYRVTTSSGLVKFLREETIVLYDENKNPIRIIGVIQDVREQNLREVGLLEEEIDKTQEKFQTIIKESNDGFEIIEANGVIKYRSPSVENITGYKSSEMIGKITSDVFEGKELEKVEEMIKFVLENPSDSIIRNVMLKTKSGKEIYLEGHMRNLLEDPFVEGILITFREITQRIKMEKEMIYNSNYDRLTGFSNREYFREKLKDICEHAKKTKREIALMILDIDNLNYINYSQGYELGDKVIVKVAKRLRKVILEDKYISRYSCSNFAFVVEDVANYQEYENVAEEIIKLMLKTFKIGAYGLNIKVNIGIAIYQEDEPDKLSLEGKAKIALMRAKKEGKNTYAFHYPELNIQNYKEFTLRSDLNNAIENNQLRVYYQPIVNINTNEIVEAEALIRWEHPEWGIVSPAEFISIAEETELIIEIGNWVLREVCKDYKKWIDNELPNIKIGVNFSGIQFLESEFVNNIRSIIDEANLDPNFLVMEITENILLKNKDKVISDIKQIQSLGIEVALDDFGTGFSSLSYLKYLNVDILKLDKTFIDNIPLDLTSNIITSTAIHLAKELKIKLIAEGIETWDQLSYLKQLNCKIGQGYLYSRPIPLEDFEKLLAKGKCKPIIPNYDSVKPIKNRRKLFRIKFSTLLEAKLTILEIEGKKINVGNTKVLIKDIGAGGLCFISNIQFPIDKNIILQFTTKLIEEEIKVYGKLRWSKEVESTCNKYGIEFIIDENDRADLIGILNQVQIKMRNDILFAEGDFILTSYNQYFNLKNKK